ncbi:hypothetical protein IQ235_02720 [Oscillatoriales cyanobacterium LEGE 11467]|uniref:Uncharacterized protein n=1 Tax=Zarconia navalis LEGE 11467 TaxID=1828826 RepID=A0A928VUT7_9CYAN|nr:hypothetical protein [Zarconia navalis]MBE9039708.1 hypothetical protein [Zarconia navalis LEGE 11467]
MALILKTKVLIFTALIFSIFISSKPALAGCKWYQIVCHFVGEPDVTISPGDEEGFTIDISNEDIDRVEEIVLLSLQKTEEAIEKSSDTIKDDAKEILEKQSAILKDLLVQLDEVVEGNLDRASAEAWLILRQIDTQVEEMNRYASDLIKLWAEEQIRVIEQVDPEILEPLERRSYNLLHKWNDSVNGIIIRAEESGDRLIARWDDTSRGIIVEGETVGENLIASLDDTGENLIVRLTDSGEKLVVSLDKVGNSLIASSEESAKNTVYTLTEELDKSSAFFFDQALMTIDAGSEIFASSLSREFINASNTLSQDLQETAFVVEEVANRITEDVESSRLRVVEGVLVTVERGAELLLFVSCTLIFLYFFYRAFDRWGPLIYANQAPENFWIKRLSYALMAGQFVTAFFPLLIFLQPIRLGILFQTNFVRPYNISNYLISDESKKAPKIWKFDTEALLIRKENVNAPDSLRVQGENLPESLIAVFGDSELEVIGHITENEAQFDLSPVYDNPNLASKIEIKLRSSDKAVLDYVPVIDYTSLVTSTSSWSTLISNNSSSTDRDDNKQYTMEEKNSATVESHNQDTTQVSPLPASVLDGAWIVEFGTNQPYEGVLDINGNSGILVVSFGRTSDELQMIKQSMSVRQDSERFILEGSNPINIYTGEIARNYHPDSFFIQVGNSGLISGRTCDTAQQCSSAIFEKIEIDSNKTELEPTDYEQLLKTWKSLKVEDISIDMFPSNSCGDSNPPGSQTWYPVFLRYNEDNLKKVREEYCADAFPHYRDEVGIRSIQIASFRNLDVAEKFAELMRREMGSGEVGSKTYR